jgi:putative ABC transport system permease protein
MKLWSHSKSTLRNLFRKPQVESHLDQELRAYIDMVTEERICSGMSASEARRTALAEFGGMEQVKQAVREHRAGTGVELLWQDVRYALRQLRRNRGFTLTAVLTLGLGIGATTAIFSAVYSLLLRPLPYHDPSQLMSVSSVLMEDDSDMLISPDFVAAQMGSKSFAQFAGYNYGNQNLTGAGDPLKVIRANVTSNFFATLGVVPQLGRPFLPGEDRNDGPPVILLSDHLWRNKFHADPEILGKAAILNGKEQTIVGVLPPRFIFPNLSVEPDYYAPAPLESDTTVSVAKPVFGMKVIARLRSGVSMEQAQAEMQAFFQARAKGYPVEIAPFARGRRMVVEPLQRHLTGDDRRPLFILLVSVAAVLLIACANVANLQLARAVSRRHETALRGALGASRLRLVRQFLVESLVLSLLAAALGLALAFVVTSLVRQAGTLEGAHVSSPTAQLLRLPFGKVSASIAVDGWVLAFAVGLAFLTTLLFGLAPAIGGARSDLRNALQAAATRISSGREQRLLRHSLLIVEVGLAVVLLTSAGLLIRSFVNVLSYDSGFDPSNTLTGVTLISGQQYDATPEKIWSFVNQLLPRLQALPGVRAAALATALPLEATSPNNAITPAGVPPPPIGTWSTVSLISITPDYFHVVGTPLREGRGFHIDDRDGAALVAIVNRAFAKQFFKGDALGKRFNTNIGGGSAYDFKTRTIVGIADDVRHGGLENEIQPEAFVPMAQVPQGRISIALRTWNDPVSLANAMRKAVTAADARQPVFDIETMEERLSSATAQRRLIMLLICCFALLAVILSAVGINGVFAYSVNQRRHEMGIRLALGASRSGLLRLVVMQAARLIVLGGMLGAGAALLLSRLLASLLVGVTPHDPVSFWLAWALMTIVALIASTLPAADAARTDLLSVLHAE